MQWCRVLGLQQTRTQEWSSCSVFLCVTSMPHCCGHHQQISRTAMGSYSYACLPLVLQCICLCRPCSRPVNIVLLVDAVKGLRVLMSSQSAPNMPELP